MEKKRIFSSDKLIIFVSYFVLIAIINFGLLAQTSYQSVIPKYAFYFIDLFNISFFSFMLTRYYNVKKRATYKHIFIFIMMFILLSTISSVLVKTQNSLYLLYGFLPFSSALLTYTITTFYMEPLRKNIKYILTLIAIYFFPSSLIHTYIHMQNDMHTNILIASLISTVLLATSLPWFYAKQSKKIFLLTLFLIPASILLPLLAAIIFVLLLFLLLLNIKKSAYTFWKNKLFFSAMIVAMTALYILPVYDENILYILLLGFIIFFALVIYTSIFFYRYIFYINRSKAIFTKSILLLIFSYVMLGSIFYKIIMINDAFQNECEEIDNALYLKNNLSYKMDRLRDVKYVHEINIDNILEIDKLYNELVSVKVETVKIKNIELLNSMYRLSNILFIPMKPINGCSTTQYNEIASQLRDMMQEAVKRIDNSFKNSSSSYLENDRQFISDDTSEYAKISVKGNNSQLAYIMYRNILKERIKKMKNMDVEDFVQIGTRELKQGTTTTASSSENPPEYEVEDGKLYEITSSTTHYSSKINRYAYLHIPVYNGYCADVDVEIKAKFTFNPFVPDSNENGLEAFFSAFGGVYEMALRAGLADATGSSTKEAFKTFGAKYASNKVTVEPGKMVILTIELDTSGFIRDGIEMQDSEIEYIHISTDDYSCKRDTQEQLRLKILNQVIYLDR